MKVPIYTKALLGSAHRRVFRVFFFQIFLVSSPHRCGIMLHYTDTPVLTSSEKAYTTSNYENVSKVGSEQDGEYPVSELSVDAKHASSVYVSGNTMLLTIDETTLTNNYGLANYDYFMNLTNFMIGNEESFTVDEKTLVNNVITLSDLGQKIIFAFVVIIIPITVLIIGLVIWIKRRNL